MKDAKGHGSDGRGTAPGYAGRDQLGRTYTQAIRDHDRFPSQNPTMPNGEDYKTPDAAAANELARGSQKSDVVPVHPGASGRSDGSLSPGGRFGYNPKAVNDAIASSNRAGRRIGGREAKMIHALLKGRG